MSWKILDNEQQKKQVTIFFYIICDKAPLFGTGPDGTCSICPRCKISRIVRVLSQGITVLSLKNDRSVARRERTTRFGA